MHDYSNARELAIHLAIHIGFNLFIYKYLSNYPGYFQEPLWKSVNMAHGNIQGNLTGTYTVTGLDVFFVINVSIFQLLVTAGVINEVTEALPISGPVVTVMVSDSPLSDDTMADAGCINTWLPFASSLFSLRLPWPPLDRTIFTRRQALKQTRWLSISHTFGWVGLYHFD